MMESCFNNKLNSLEEVGDIDEVKKDLLSEFNSIPLNQPSSQDSTLDESERLQVYLRVRPFTSSEAGNGESQDCVAIEPPDTVLLRAPRSSFSARQSDKSVPLTTQRFQFSQVYGPETSQREMFEGTVRGLVRDVLEGENSVVFTYGVTNAGKTFTFLGSEANAGLLPRALNVIFNSIEERVYTQMSIKPQRCRDFSRLTKEQQSEEAISKNNLFRLLKENDGQKSTASSTSKTTLEGSNLLDTGGVVSEDSFSLDVDTHTKFSIWVSFCEIYKENIHDLLESVPTGALRRTMLRLSQDVKGNSFVKDLRWVQVNSAEEAYKVMKLGKKNQSFSSTKLNHLSSRSHSIFSIRILRIEDVGIPHVKSISELSLCDLAGSERCAKAQTNGERLKEAGNINTSLLILGNCIKALRHNQMSKLQKHVPFRESKLTHYLQSFFCGRGKACMIVNINQCASMYDETLNVLKFSAIAQKVVVTTTKILPILSKKSARDVSFIINNADRVRGCSRRSSLVGWDTSLEDVQENEDDVDNEEEDSVTDEEEEESVMEETIQTEDSGDEDDDEILVNKELYRRQVALLELLQEQLKKERAESLAQEGRIREEVFNEFSELYSKMRSECDDRLVKEKDIIEWRSERRLEILKSTITKNPSQEETDEAETPTEDKSLDSMFNSMNSDLAGIKHHAQAAQTCLMTGAGPKDPRAQGCGRDETMASLERRVAEMAEQLKQAQEMLSGKTTELDNYHSQAQQLNQHLEEEKKNRESCTLKFSELMEICHEKDVMISRLETTVTEGKLALESNKEEMLRLKNSCTCFRGQPSSDGRKRHGDSQTDLEGQPPSKKGGLGEQEVDRLRAELQEMSSDMERLVVQRGELESCVKGCRRLEERLGELEDKRSREEEHARELTRELEEARQGLEEALASLEEAKQGKDEALSDLEEAKQGKEEALAALEEAKQGKEEALAALEEAKQGKEEALSALEEAKQGKEEALSALEEAKQGKEEALSALEEAKQGKEEALSALEEAKQGKEEALSALEEAKQGKEEARLVLERENQDRDMSLFRQEAQVLAGKIEAIQREASEQTTRADQALNDLQAAQARLERSDYELREKTAQIQSLTQEVKHLGQEMRAVEETSGAQRESGQAREKVTALRKALFEAQQEKEKRLLQVQELEQDKDQLSQQQLTSDQQMEEMKQKLKEQQLTLEQQLDELNQKLSQQELTSDQQIKELKEKLDKQMLYSEQQLDEFKQKLSEQQLTSDQLMGKLEEAAAEFQKSDHGRSEEEDKLRRLNSDLEANVTSLKSKVTDLEEKQRARDTESEATAALTQSDSNQLASLTMEKTEMWRRLAEKEEEMERRLVEKEAQVSGLQRRLKEAQEVREEAENAAVQEARRREVERRRELLAVAEEAIAQKDAELEKRAKEISSLKEAAKQNSDTVKSISLDLQRKDDDTSDLKEKLADSKKQIQQVQKEISSMRDVERSLRQRLQDMEKAKKQLQTELASRDRTVQQLRTDSKPDDSLPLYQQACKDLQARERVIEDMRLAMVEQEETQEQMDQVLKERLDQILDLSDEVEKLRGTSPYQDAGKDAASLRDSQLDNFKLAIQESAQAQESLKLSTEKHQADRRKWQEEKMSLIRQAKEAEDKRNQEMRKFADDRERHSKQQSHMEALSAQLSEKEQDMERWRKERDTLVAALEVQLQKLLCSNAEKDKVISSLRCSAPSQPPEVNSMGVRVAELQAALSERETEVNRLKEQLKATDLAQTKRRETATQTKAEEVPASVNGKPHREGTPQVPGGSDARGSVSSQGSASYPSVLDSSQISTENGRTSRFPKPELEISFSPLQPNRLALRRQGEDDTVTIKMNTRSARKRKSTDLDKKKGSKLSKTKKRTAHEHTTQDEVESENRRNTRTRLTPKLAPHQEEWGSPAGGSGDQSSMRPQNSQTSVRSKKDGTLQKIGDFFQSSPNLFGSKAKKIMGLVSGRSPDPEGGSTLGGKHGKSKRKLYRPKISSPMDFPSHPIISRDPEEKESDHMIIKRRLRTRTGK